MVEVLDPAYLRRTVSSSIRSFPDTEFLNLPVVQDFLMPFMIGLFTLVFTQRMRPFNSLFLPLSSAQSVLMRHCGHQVDKHIVDGGYHRAGDGNSLRRVFV